MPRSRSRKVTPAIQQKSKKALRAATRATRQARSRLGVRSQTVIPRAVREALSIAPGDDIVFEISEHGVTLRKSGRGEDNPFALFTEWSSESDAKGYADL